MAIAALLVFAGIKFRQNLTYQPDWAKNSGTQTHPGGIGQLPPKANRSAHLVCPAPDIAFSDDDSRNQYQNLLEYFSRTSDSHHPSGDQPRNDDSQSHQAGGHHPAQRPQTPIETADAAETLLRDIENQTLLRLHQTQVIPHFLMRIYLETGLDVGRSIKNYQIKLEPDHALAEFIVDLNTLPKSELPGIAEKGLEFVTSIIPAKNAGELYIGLDLYPVQEEGHLIFDDRTRIYIGKIPFSVQSVAENCGVSSVFRLSDFHIEEFKISQSELLLKQP